MLGGTSLVGHLTDPETGEVVPITLVIDNGGPLRSFRFEHFITAHPVLRRVRTRVRTPGQKGVRERAFQSLRYERLYASRSTMGSTWSARPMSIGSSSTPSDHTNTWLGTGPPRSTVAWRTPSSPPFPSPKSHQLVDEGQSHARGARLVLELLRHT